MTEIKEATPEQEWVMVPKEPTEAMHNAARDWSAAKYGKPIGLDASDGCYRAMLAARPVPSTEEVEKDRDAWKARAEEQCRLAYACAKAARAEANHLRKVGALLEARCLGAERVRDDLEAALDAARAALREIGGRAQKECAFEGRQGDRLWKLCLGRIAFEAEEVLSDHQTGEQP